MERVGRKKNREGEIVREGETNISMQSKEMSEGK